MGGPRQGGNRRRLVVVVLVVLVALAVAALLFAVLRPSDSEGPDTFDEALALGDPVRGADVYVVTCAECHGPSGEGHTGPALIGNPISITAAREAIENGTENMPGGLVDGQEELDVLAFLTTMLAQQSGG